MLTQHLTVVQNKYLFMSKEGVAYLCDSGVHPEDMKQYDLRPIIVVTLAAEKLGLYWQRLYFADEPIPLASFLYLAWTEFHTLGGIPDRLLVESELLNAYPLRRVLAQIDREKIIKRIGVGTSRQFAATKRYSQSSVKHCMDPELIDRGENEASRTQEGTLAQLNKALERYHRKWETRPRPGHDETEYLAHRHRRVHLPTWPNDLETLSSAEWMQSQAFTVPRLAPMEILRAEFTWGSRGWVRKVLDLPDAEPEFNSESEFEPGTFRTAVRTVLMMGGRDPRERYSVDDLLFFKSVVSALPFPPYELFGEILKPGEFEVFFDGIESIDGATADRLELYLFEGPDRGGLVLFPDSSAAFEDALELLGNGGDERCCAELVGHSGDVNLYPFPYRVFVLDDGGWLSLLAVRRGSATDVPNLRAKLRQSLGAIDIGAPGMAAISYFLEHYIEGKPRAQSLGLLQVVEHMLSTIPKWTEADHPADY
ncbi:hypothetical protein [Pseudomonas nitroreducens]|uniref:hypothetical protein n=1 Tax=Pseudomonas nitroreducens TaxID=46680 RepID=UPI00351D72E4